MLPFTPLHTETSGGPMKHGLIMTLNLCGGSAAAAGPDRRLLRPRHPSRRRRTSRIRAGFASTSMRRISSGTSCACASPSPASRATACSSTRNGCPEIFLATGPIERLAGLKVTASGSSIAWTRDTVQMYAFHLHRASGSSAIESSSTCRRPARARAPRNLARRFSSSSGTRSCCIRRLFHPAFGRGRGHAA